MTLLIFDLDGTLIDSRLDLAHSANATRAYTGMEPIANELVYSYVGNGAPVLIRRILGPEASEQDVQRALDFFIRYYGQHCLDNTVLYPGVKEALDRLHGKAVSMAVLTNKPVRISNHILRRLGVGGHFFRVYGGNSFGQKKPDPIGVNTLLEETGSPREKAVMVGDSAVDVRTARNAGIRACGVKYGFQPESFSNEPPDLLIDDLSELANEVLGQ
jgi:phosphoglycolate phosphatase